MRENPSLSSLVIITGMSGSGKHTAFKAFEDLGYFCVDNLPTSLIPRLVQMSGASGGKIEKLAVVVDVRLRESIRAFEKLFQAMKTTASRTTVIFVDAADEVLVRRYSETRRSHPLAEDGSLLDAVQAERRTLAPVRAMADVVIDTANFTVHDLRNFIYQNFRREEGEEKLRISLVSFGFKHGIPYNSDLVFDVRFLPNPNFVPDLKPRTGNDAGVVEYMKGHAETEEVLGRLQDVLEYLIPKYMREGKSYLTISIGCTGGRHRSVMVANELKARLEESGHCVSVVHRDLHVE